MRNGFIALYKMLGQNDGDGLAMDSSDSYVTLQMDFTTPDHVLKRLLSSTFYVTYWVPYLNPTYPSANLCLEHGSLDCATSVA